MKAFGKSGFCPKIYTIFVWLGLVIYDYSILPASASTGQVDQSIDSANFRSVQTQDTIRDEVFIAVEKMPEFPGGINGLVKYLQKNIRYPKECKQVIGKITLSFVITKTGKVQDVNATAGSCDAPKWRQHTIAAIKAMPTWKPGMQKGKAANVRYSLPVYIHPMTE
jgi:hypothetical protein